MFFEYGQMFVSSDVKFRLLQDHEARLLAHRVPFIVHDFERYKNL